MTGKKNTEHLFYSLKGTSPEGPFLVSAGLYRVSKGYLYRDIITSDEAEWLDIAMNACNNLHSDNLHVLVYIHGYLAENPWFASINGYTLHEEIFDIATHDINVVLSLQWDSGFQYTRNRMLAFKKGLVFQSLLKKVDEKSKAAGKTVTFSFLLHSMGNIVFEGLMYGIEKGKAPWQTRQVFCCAADLASNIFDSGLHHIPDIAADIHVLYNQEDKTLRLANLMQNFRRLGIYGREDQNNAENIHSLDATRVSSDDRAIGSRFSHHRYFYGSKKVVNYINKWLSKR